MGWIIFVILAVLITVVGTMILCVKSVSDKINSDEWYGE